MEENLSYKVNDVISAFENLPETGKHEKIKNLHYFSNIGSEHIQGYTRYRNNEKIYYIFSHNTTGDYGYLLISIGKDDKSPQTIKLEKDWKHPGGIQAIGRYIFIPCEKEKESQIFIFDMETEKFVEPSTMIAFEHEGSCLGITDYEENGTNYYFLLVGDHEKYYGYRAEVPSNMSQLKFESLGSINLKDKGYKNKKMNCQGIGLVTDSKDKNIYMIGLMSYTSLATYDDWAYVIRITINENADKNGNKITAKKIKERHLKNDGGISGVAGSHFRWGAGIAITPEGELEILTTSRNIIAGTKLDTTFWAK